MASTRILAYLGFSGTILDVMGGLYLGYDLLGGRDGPLSLITRIATYCLFFGLCYGIALGPTFGIISGLGLGIVLALEFHRLSRYQRLYKSSPLQQSPWFALARGFVMGSAASFVYGLEFGALFGMFSAFGLYVITRMGLNPSNGYIAQARLQMSKRRIFASLLRGVAIGLAGGFAAWIETANRYSIQFGLFVGVVVGAVSVVLTTASPMVEWWIDNMPDRHMLLMGLGMIFLGCVLQSIQYLAVIFGFNLG